MASGTVTKVIQTADPTNEVVILDLDNGDTYSSRKFASLDGGHITVNESSTAGSATFTVSGQTATIYTTSSRQTVTLTLFGGN